MTLTEAAFWTKRFGVIAAVMFLIFVIIILALTLQPKKALPNQYLTANYACTEKKEEFLKDSPIKITPLRLARGSELLFEITTDTGRIDSLPKVVDVYRFAHKTQVWSSRKNAQILAAKMGFDPETVTTSTTVYSWQDTIQGKNLDIQAKNMNFTLRSNAKMLHKETQGKAVPTEQDAKRRAANILRNLGVYSEDYSEGFSKTTYIKVNPDGSFSKARSADQAQLIKVDFFRKKPMLSIPSSLINSREMVNYLTNRLDTQPEKNYRSINGDRVEYSTFNTRIAFHRTQNSNISVYVGAPANIKDKTGSEYALADIYQIDYTYYPLEQESCGTYELLAPQIALERVQSGEHGYLVYLYEKDGDDISPYKPQSVKKFMINKDISIVYYEPEKEATYLQPMYLISGEVIFSDDRKGEFDFYYPAINYDIVQDKINLPPQPVKKKKSSLL